MALAPRSAGTSRRHLFVYGSLVDPRRLDEVLGYRFQGERLRASLHGFRRIESDGYAYPFLVEQAAENVEGMLIMDLEPHQFDVLDRYEEVDTGVYQRIEVEVEAWGCGPRPTLMPAQTYIAGPQLRSTAR